MAGGTDDRRASVEVQRAPLEDGPTTSITGEPRVCGPRHAQASTSEGLESTGEASTAVLGSRQAFLAGLQPGSLEAAGELQVSSNQLQASTVTADSVAQNLAEQGCWTARLLNCCHQYHPCAQWRAQAPVSPKQRYFSWPGVASSWLLHSQQD